MQDFTHQRYYNNVHVETILLVTFASALSSDRRGLEARQCDTSINGESLPSKNCRVVLCCHRSGTLAVVSVCPLGTECVMLACRPELTPTKSEIPKAFSKSLTSAALLNFSRDMSPPLFQCKATWTLKSPAAIKGRGVSLDNVRKKLVAAFTPSP